MLLFSLSDCLLSDSQLYLQAPIVWNEPLYTSFNCSIDQGDADIGHVGKISCGHYDRILAAEHLDKINVRVKRGFMDLDLRRIGALGTWTCKN